MLTCLVLLKLYLSVVISWVLELLVWMVCYWISRYCMKYFRISLGRDKNKWGKWSFLLISWCALDKVRYQSLKFDCKCYITPFYWCSFPHSFLSRPREILKYINIHRTFWFFFFVRLKDEYDKEGEEDDEACQRLIEQLPKGMHF